MWGRTGIDPREYHLSAMLIRTAALTTLLLITLQACSGGDSGPSEPPPEPTCYDLHVEAEAFEAIAPQLNNLVGSWGLDCDGKDSSGKENHGEVLGPLPTEDRFGRPGRALRFNGKGDYISFASGGIATSTHYFSVALWFRSDAETKGTLYFEGNSEGPGILLRLQPDGALWAHSNDAFTLKAKGEKYNDGAWHHVVLRAAENSVTLWLDGKLAVEGEWSEDFHLKETKHPPVLGRTGEPDSKVSRDVFTGDLDEVAVFHRPISFTEIDLLFKEGPNQLPSAVPTVKILGMELTVSAKESLDRDGEITSYQWDFGDGSATSTEQDVVHTYAEPGVYPVSLTVTDNEGGVSQTSVIVEAFDPTDHTTDGPWPKDWAEWELDVIDLVNQRRAEGAVCGGEPYKPAGPVENNNFCRLSARLHSEDMAKQGFFDHTGLDGSTPFDRMAAAGYDGPMPWGENIAAGQTSPASVVQAWMDSPGHCRNIMNAGYEVLGVGYYYEKSSGYGHYWTQNFGGGH